MYSRGSIFAAIRYLYTMANFIIAFFLLQLLQLCLAASKYYYPNGSEANDHPCDLDAAQSVCCSGGLGTLCLSNNLCMGANGNTMRGSCTDKNWASPECAMFCLGADQGGTDLISCSNVTNSDTSYCCDHNADCCNSGVGRFNVFPSEPEVWATWNPKTTQYDVVGTIFSGQTTTDIPSSIASSFSTTTSVAAPPSNSASDTSETAGASKGISTGAKVGIGAGIVVGSVMAATAVYLFWKTRKNEKAVKQDEQQPRLYNNLVTDCWQQSHYGYASKNYQYQLQPPNELSGTPLQGYIGRVELPAHN